MSVSAVSDVSELDAFVLCGGLGMRLRSAVADRPKVLAEVGGRPFVEILLGELRRRGIRRFVLCAGYRAGALRDALPALARFGEIRVSVEAEPLGTGGGLVRALPLARSDPLLVVNGDTVCPVDLARMLAEHRARGAALTMAVVRAEAADDRGGVHTDREGRLLRFGVEGAAAGSAPFQNAGVYLIDRAVLEKRTRGVPFSLERDLFPLVCGDAYAFLHEGSFLDIGTPERYGSAEGRLRAMGLS